MGVAISLAFTSLSSTIVVFPLVGFRGLNAGFEACICFLSVLIWVRMFFWAGKATYDLADVLISGLPRGPDSTVV